MAAAFKSDHAAGEKRLGSLLIDISPVIGPQSAVWPGDVPFSRHVALDVKSGNNITLSSITSTVHIGAHADAPSHFHSSGQSIDAVALDAYVGPCEVVTVRMDGRTPPLIGVADCRAALNRGARRLLFRTQSQPNPNHFNTDFAALSADAVDAMGRAGVVLLGIDTPSVDPFDSKDLPAHQMLFHHGIRNLEGLVLAHVIDGAYELIALPLKLAHADASPVRAVLRKL